MSVSDIKVYVPARCLDFFFFFWKEGVFSNHLEIQCFLCPSVGFAHRARGPVKQAVQAHWADTSKAIVHQKMDPCFLTSTRWGE